MNDGKVILYIATSLDDFIADSDGGVDWLPQSEDPQDLVGYKALMNRISIVVMGSRSYNQILGFGEWAWSNKHTYVFTFKKDLVAPHPDVITFTDKNPKDFMEMLKSQKSPERKGDIWLLGGSELIKSFAAENLIDECIITIIPVTIHKGIKLGLELGNFTLVSEKKCMDGIIQKTFKKLENTRESHDDQDLPVKPLSI